MVQVIVATRHAYISGVDADEATRLLELSIKNPNLCELIP